MIEIKEIITDNKDLQYIKECAESVGMDVTDRTVFTIPFIAEVMRKMKEQSIVIPKGATNGDMIKAMFPDKELWQVIASICLGTFDHNYSEIYKSSWWNSPYRKEQE